MTLDEINEAALLLYRDEQPAFRRGVLCDALSELSPALTWREWLEVSGTLDRLAECMVQAEDESLEVSPELMAWIARLEISPRRFSETPHLFFRDLCAVFEVPIVQILVSELFRLSFTNTQSWVAPSRGLARVVLQECLRAAGNWPLDGRILSGEAVRNAVRRFHPRAVGYRVREPRGSWEEKTL
jgi:hypothetical protein